MSYFTLRYRLVGSIDYPTLTREFTTIKQCRDFIRYNPIYVISLVNPSGTSIYKPAKYDFAKRA
jgi:hypothetical protein